MKQPIFIGNDSLFTLADFADDADGGGSLDAATVEVTIRDLDGDEVAGISWPITMAKVTAPGTYEGTVQSTIVIVDGQQYVATITAVEGTVNGEWIIELFGDRREL